MLRRKGGRKKGTMRGTVWRVPLKTTLGTLEHYINYNAFKL
jgi:hypothetical protein